MLFYIDGFIRNKINLITFKVKLLYYMNALLFVFRADVFKKSCMYFVHFKIENGKNVHSTLDFIYRNHILAQFLDHHNQLNLHYPAKNEAELKGPSRHLSVVPYVILPLELIVFLILFLILNFSYLSI